MKHDGYIFLVTAEVITADSAEQGDAAERGYIDTCGRWQDVIPGWRWPECWDLRDLTDHLPCGWTESDGSTVPRWLTIDPGMDWWLCTLCQELADSVAGDVLGVTFSVHRPDSITDASWLRVCRMLGWRQCY